MAGLSAVPITTTKLQVPRWRRPIRRERLVASITAAADAKLVLVLAPAGAGKTTLLSEWRSSPDETRPFAWLSLDAGDNDPVKLFEGVVAALRTVEPSLGEQALNALAGPAPLTEIVLPSLVNELEALKRPLVLVLDDLHLVHNARVHEALSLLLERLPANVQLAMASRSEPPLPLGRLRVRREMIEVRAEDLRFTDDEASVMLCKELGFALEPEDLARLQERTEGWAAGLHLAALSLGTHPDTSAFIASFAGDDRPVVDYLGFEVLDGQPDDVRSFLLRTSVLQRLTGPLCDAVLDSEGSALRLDVLERAGLFLLPLDSKRQWYRCHHLFRELLCHELVRAEPDLVPELHARACGWYRQQGDVGEAIHHATAAGALDTASDLITEHWYGFLQRGRIETVGAWLEALGDEAIALDAGMCLTKAWLGVNTGRLETVARWIEAAERAPGREQGPVEAGIASLREIHRYMGGDVGRAVEAGRRSVERGGTPWRPVGCPVLGIALFWSGNAEDAARELEDSVSAARQAGNHLAEIHASAALAAISAEQGGLDEAGGAAAQALELAERHSLSGHWATTMAHVVQGRSLQRRGLLAEAGEEMARAVELSRGGVAAVEIAYALLGRADSLRLQGRAQAAASNAGEARDVIELCPDPGILPTMLARTERQLRLASSVRTAVDDPHAQELTERELQVLALLPTQLTQREMGSALFLSLNTIKTHVRGIYRKLNVDSRDAAVERARCLDLL